MWPSCSELKQVSSQPPGELIHIIFSYDDVDLWAEELGIDIGLARERAESWARSIEDSAVQRISDQLASVIEFDNP